MAQVKKTEAERIEALESENAALKARKKIVGISHNHAGELHALTEDGKIFKYVHDKAAMNQPGVHMTWQEVQGP